MKNTLIISLIVGLVFLQVILIMTRNRNSQNISNLVHNLKMEKKVSEQLTNRIKLIYENSEFNVNPETKLISEAGDSLKLKMINFEKYIFVVRFSEFNCQSCISTEMKKIAQFVNINKDVLCVASYTRLEDLIINKRMINLQLPIYNMHLGMFKNTIENQKLAYYFIMDHTYKAQHLFIADPNNEELTLDYLEYVGNMLKK